MHGAEWILWILPILRILRMVGVTGRTCAGESRDSFNNQYKAFTTTLFPKPPTTSSIEWKDYIIDSKWEWPELEKIEVKQAIFSFSKKKAPGPDKLSFEILQKAYPTIEDLLNRTFKILFTLGY